MFTPPYEQALFEAATAANQLFLLLLFPFCALFQAAHLPVLHESSSGAGFVQSERSFLELHKSAAPWSVSPECEGIQCSPCFDLVVGGELVRAPLTQADLWCLTTAVFLLLATRPQQQLSADEVANVEELKSLWAQTAWRMLLVEHCWQLAWWQWWWHKG